MVVKKKKNKKKRFDIPTSSLIQYKKSLLVL